MKDAVMSSELDNKSESEFLFVFRSCIVPNNCYLSPASCADILFNIMYTYGTVDW